MEIFGNKILDVLISLVLIYALLSILVSILIEAYNHKTKARGKLLREAIFKMLNDPQNLDWGHLFYNHHLIKGMKSPEGHLPQYIPAEIFAEVVCDLISQTKRHEHRILNVNTEAELENKYEVEQKNQTSSYMQRFETALKEMNPSPLSDLLNDYWEKAGEDLDQMKESLMIWFNSYMDRVSGWYKVRQKKKFLIAGTIVAVCLNVDSLHLIKIVSTDEKLRLKLVNEAINVNYREEIQNDGFIFEPHNSTDLKKRKWTTEEIQEWTAMKAKREDSLYVVQLKKADSIINYLSEQEIPIGWSTNSAPVSWVQKSKRNIYDKTGILQYIEKRNYQPGLGGILYYLLGIGISAISLSFGAPFWFDMLMKLVNLRQSGKRPENNAKSKK